MTISPGYGNQSGNLNSLATHSFLQASLEVARSHRASQSKVSPNNYSDVEDHQGEDDPGNDDATPR